MDKIAIIGMSCLFPDAKSPDQLIRNLLDERDSVSIITKNRIQTDPDCFFVEKRGVADTFYNKKGGYIHDFRFDPTGFALAENELEQLDDLNKWSLYVAREAIKDAGYESRKRELARCGVAMGNLSFPTRKSNQLFLPLYHRCIDAAIARQLRSESIKITSDAVQRHQFSNSRISAYPSHLISKALSLSGTAFSLDAACATSLYAIKLASDYLLSGKCDLMLAGAVSGADPFFIKLGFSLFQAYPENGRSCPLDQNTQGLIAGEGAAMIVLKRYADAVRDQDRIYAIVDGIGLSNDGRGKFVLVPKMEGQYLAMKRAYAIADASPDHVDYLECHATGTPLGDVTELESIDAWWGECAHTPLIGSVKSNFGHMLTAAGMASLLKIILGMQCKTIPATIRIDSPVSSPKGTISPQKIVRKSAPWPKRSGDKIAAVNAFGFGGTNAHMIVRQKRQWHSVRENSQKRKSCATFRMAITGMNAQFGAGNGLQELAYNIYTENQNRRHVPKNRWKGIDRQTEILRHYSIDHAESLQGAYLDEFEMDFAYFKIPPNDIEHLLPQQLLMVKVADRAISDANLKMGQNVGVIVAMGSDHSLHQFRGRIDLSCRIREALNKAGVVLPAEDSSELERVLKDSVHEAVGINEFTSYIGNIMACRISALWDFMGPSLTLSAEENSLFRAVEIAQMMLESGEVEAVVVGAVDLAGSAEEVLIRHNYCAKVDTKAGSSVYSSNNDGWNIGEGAGAVVLTAVDNARKSQEHVYAVIESLTIRSGESAEELQEICTEALRQSGCQSKDIGYVEINDGLSASEAHATALSNIYSQSNDTASAIGSTAANFGHTFAASGVAALIKSVLCLYHRFLPAIPNWETLRFSKIAKDTKLYVPDRSRTWFLNGSETRKAAISSLDSNDTLAHMVMSEDSLSDKRPGFYLDRCTLRLFLIKANHMKELESKCFQLKDLLGRSDNFKTAADIWHHNQLMGTEAIYCLSLLGDNTANLLQEIDSAIRGAKKAIRESGDWESPSGSYFTSNPLGSDGKIAFVYPGGFSSYLGMQKDLFQLFPDLDNLIRGIKLGNDSVYWDRLMFPRNLPKRDRADYEQEERALQKNTIAMFESGMVASMLNTAMLRGTFGIRPDIALGYSIGEVSMLFSLDVWRDASLFCENLRSSLLFKEKLVGKMTTIRSALKIKSLKKTAIWKTFVVRAPKSVIEKEIAKFKHLYLIIVNSPKEVIIAGETDACKAFLASHPYSYRELAVNGAIHCDPIKAEIKQLEEMYRLPVSKVSNITFITTADDKPVLFDSKALARDLAERFCSRFDFFEVVRRAHAEGASIFIEMGPRQNCGKWISETLEGKPHTTIPIDRKGLDELDVLLRALAKLTSHNVDVDLTPLFGRYANMSTKSKTVKTITLGGKHIASEIQKRGIVKLLKKFDKEKQTQTEQKKELKRKTENRPHTSSQITSHPESAFDRYRLGIRKTHSAFLSQRREALGLLKEMICAQISGTSRQAFAPEKADIVSPEANGKKDRTRIGEKQADVLWDEDDLLEFARGRIANVFGEKYAVIDSYTCRVRLPLPPYLLVSRVTRLNAVMNRFKPSSITTEYDIPRNSWFCVDGQIPWAVAVESGQCDLLLISYMGIDFQCRGNRMYRLLDCTLTFVDRMPLEGDVLRYEIKIDSFARQGKVFLFFFRYDCFVKQKLVLKMRGGCAGFFSLDELSRGRGVILSPKELKERSQVKKSTFRPLLACTKKSFTRSELVSITKGKLEECFGVRYTLGSSNRALRFSAEQMLMHDRIISIETQGGLWGLGEVISEKDLAPDHWYFPCHFKDDQVLAGSLMAEGCVQLLQFYMLYIGLHVKTQNARFQPIRNLPNVVRCRGQVIQTDRLLTYKLEVTEIGLEPHPYAKGNVDIILDRKVIVNFKDVGVELVEKS